MLPFPRYSLFFRVRFCDQAVEVLDERCREERVAGGERREKVASTLEELCGVGLNRGEQILQTDAVRTAQGTSMVKRAERWTENLRKAA